MSNNLTKMLFNNVIMIGVMITFCSNNWISMWMGMEMSLLSIIPLMLSNKKISSESSIKYFITQSVASTIMMLGIMIMLIGVSINYEMIISIAMAIKIGLAPFHNWIIITIEGMEYNLVLMILTIMKIPPVTIISYLSTNMTMMIWLTMIVGAIMSLNQSSLKKIMGYSSMFNMSLLLTTINSKLTWNLFMLMYSIMTFTLIKPLKEMKINFINQIQTNEKNNSTKVILWMLILSMGGFPPMIGFFNKMMVIQMLIKSNELFLLLILIYTSLLVMFFYMRMTFNIMLTNSISKKWFMKSYKSYYWLMMINLMMFPSLMLIKSIT